jgi:hypothetical protein
MRVVLRLLVAYVVQHNGHSPKMKNMADGNSFSCSAFT